MIDFYSKDNLKYEGIVDKQFKVWLECNFGYYTQGLLVSAVWDSTVVYQYDYEADKICSTFDSLSFQNTTSWRIYEDDNGEFYLSFYWDDALQTSYVMSWLSYKKPDYVNFKHVQLLQ